MMSVLDALKHGLIVSCQALEEEPLHGPWLMAGMAWAANQGGAAGIRANGAEDVRAIKAATGLPVIGIEKQVDSEKRLCITPDREAAKRIIDAGADIIAIDCRAERPFGDPLDVLIDFIHQHGRLVMADCRTIADAANAESLGADVVGTTFAFQEGKYGSEPDFPLIEKLVGESRVPVIAEGGFWTPEEVLKALTCGVYAVVVGTAITRPQDITKRFVRAIERYFPEKKA